ncbi:hypothetical protein VTI74DRAFT_8867 [Chaetomium olivicolor]
MRKRQPPPFLRSTHVHFSSQCLVLLLQTCVLPTTFHAGHARSIYSRPKQPAKATFTFPALIRASDSIARISRQNGHFRPESSPRPSTCQTQPEAFAQSEVNWESLSDHDWSYPSPQLTLVWSESTPSLQPAEMDPNQPWNWPQQRQDGYAPPNSNGQNQMNAMHPFGMQFGLPSNFTHNWSQQGQQATQYGGPSANQHPRQDDGRGWRERAFYSQYDYRDHRDDWFGRSVASNYSDQRDRGVDRSSRYDRGDQYNGATFGRRREYNGVDQHGPEFGRRDRPYNNRGRRDEAFNQPPPWRNTFMENPPQPQRAASSQGSGAYQTPRQRRKEQRRAAGPPDHHRRAPDQRRATAPTWNFRDEDEKDRRPPFPMNDPPAGPFGTTQPLQQNTALNTPSSGVELPGLTTLTSDPRPPPKNKKTKTRGAAETNAAQTNAAQRPPQPDRDAISAPSAASGGVPSPSPSYLSRALLPPTPSSSRQPILVIIDLNGTLLYRPQKRSPSKFVERPLARTFLQHVLAKHHVVIWSSARPENVERMCAQLLSRSDLDRVIAVWGRDRFGLTRDDYNRRTQCYKRLTRLWSDPVVGASHPNAAQGGMWDQGNTVLIDDSAEKARSEPHNAVTLPEFAGDVKEQPQVLALVEKYLDELAWQGDVSAYMRMRPFKMAEGEVAAVEELD